MFIGSANRLTRTENMSPALALELRAATLDSRLTFSRASAATDIINGVLTSFASDTPRISSANGLLMEESRTNLAFGSTFVNGGGVTVTAGQADPLGGSAAYLCTEDTASGAHIAQSNAVTFTAANYTVSAFIKAGTCDRIQLRMGGNVTTNGYANFYLAGAGSMSAAGAGVVASSIQALSGGWYRLSITFLATASQLGEIKIYPIFTGSEAGNPVTTGTGRSFMVYGCQCEAGAFISSYIPTTTVAATRALESCSLPIDSWYNESEGTLLADGVSGSGYDSAASINNRLVRLDNGGNTAVHEMRRNNTDNTSRMGTVASNVAQSSLVTGTWANASPVRMAYAYKANDMAGCLNGGSVQTDTTSPEGMPTGLTTLRLGSAISSGAFGGYVRSIKYWRSRLNNDQLKAMTS